MSIQLVLATTAISLALVFYTIGVFDERKHSLTKRNLVLFWTGFVFDTTGTTIMTMMAQDGGSMALGMHAASGVLAIILMAAHATWATVTYVRGSERAKERFHTFSIVVWLFWLMPYTLGVLQGVPMLHLANLQAGIGSLVVVGVAALVVVISSTHNRKHHLPRS
ncbi:MAG: HsmA family protein [Gordonibacter sp.]|nr:HsmA family protein [Gordonibacter sp.]